MVKKRKKFQQLYGNTPEILRTFWCLDKKVVFLNHGSFGATPKMVLEFQTMLRHKMEKEPILFLWKELENRLDKERNFLGKVFHCSSEDLVFVPNATTGVNTVLKSFDLKPGDEVIVTTPEYNACRNALNFAAETKGAKVVAVEIPFPITSPEVVLEKVLGAVTEKTRLALIDHVTSPTALIFPIVQIIRELEKKGIDCLIDGAHGPGMLNINLDELGAAYYTGNLHKWFCAPKGAAFLHVRKDRQKGIRPLAVSHGANSQRKDKSNFQIEFAWTGTDDPTPFLVLSSTWEFLENIFPGGIEALMKVNHDLALKARKVICEKLSIPVPCPDEMIGSMASIPLPDARNEVQNSMLNLDPFQELLFTKYNIEVPIMNYPSFPKRILRISCMPYNDISQYEFLAEAIKKEIRN